MVRQAHHPEQSRRANFKFQYRMTKTGFEFRLLVIVICLEFEICYLDFVITPLILYSHAPKCLVLLRGHHSMSTEFPPKSGENPILEGIFFP
jgi:hypothetical protein